MLFGIGPTVGLTLGVAAFGSVFGRALLGQLGKICPTLCGAFEMKLLRDHQIANNWVSVVASACIALTWLTLPWTLWIKVALTLVSAVILLMSTMSSKFATHNRPTEDEILALKEVLVLKEVSRKGVLDEPHIETLRKFLIWLKIAVSSVNFCSQNDLAASLEALMLQLPVEAKANAKIEAGSLKFKNCEALPFSSVSGYIASIVSDKFSILSVGQNIWCILVYLIKPDVPTKEEITSLSQTITAGKGALNDQHIETLKKLFAQFKLMLPARLCSSEVASAGQAIITFISQFENNPPDVTAIRKITNPSLERTSCGAANTIAAIVDVLEPGSDCGPSICNIFCSLAPKESV